MQCPTDSSVLVMSERNGIEIDYCPQCRGVWLDRGELDKILERASAQMSPAPSPAPQGGDGYEPGSYEYERDQRREQQQRDLRSTGTSYGQRAGGGYGGQYGGHDRRKRKKNWLEEIFD